jgi:KipI family sensor histidine kinase inhibitor
VRAFAAAVEASPPGALRETVPTYRSVTVHFDPLHPQAGDVEDQLRAAEARMAGVALPSGKLHVIPVHYGGEDGPDLEDVASLHGITPQHVVDLHARREYLVYCVGFSPGFAFLGGLPEDLHTPRLETPRKLVPAGSVGIGGQQTGVYPVATPGGWRLIGRTSFTFFNLAAEPPCPISTGDRVRFEAVDTLPPGENTRMNVPADENGDPVLEVIKPGLFTTVQDLGRWGYQASGVSVAGAMDPLALRLANALVGNAAGQAGLEITLTGPTLRVRKACVLALAGAPMELRLNGRPAAWGLALELKPADELEIGRAARGARAYLGLAGGIEVPLALGSRSTYTRAGFGGLAGRALKAGDVLAAGPAAGLPPRSSAAELPLPTANEVTLRTVLGPQDDHFSPESIERLLREPFRITTDADRMGCRLASQQPLTHRGPAEIPSDGVALGSVQVPPQGQPIVMLADRASVGGYPKIATVVSADVRLLAQCRPGMRVRFQQVSPEEGRQALRELEEQWLTARPAEVGLPVAEVRELLGVMRARGLSAASLDSPEVRLQLTRRSGH